MEIYSKFGPKNSTAKISFIKRVLKWSKPQEQVKTIEGSEEERKKKEEERQECEKVNVLLHTKLAESYANQKEFAEAAVHFIRGDDADSFGKMLVEWSQEGNPSERDLFITRAVLQ